MSLMQRLSCCTFPLQEMEVGAAFAAIAAAGFAKVDVLGRPPHLDLSDPSSTANAAARSSLAVANLGTYSGKGFAAEPAEQKEAFVELCKALDTAQAMGARSIRVSAVRQQATLPLLLDSHPHHSDTHPIGLIGCV